MIKKCTSFQGFPSAAAAGGRPTKSGFLSSKTHHYRFIGFYEMEEGSENESNPDLQLKPDSDGVMAIILCVFVFLGLLICGFYLWKSRKNFGFEDKR